MEESKFILLMKQSIGEGVIVSIFSNRNQPDKCSVGYVAKISGDEVLINHVTTTGLNDGYVVRKLKDVYRIDINGQYEKKLHGLYTLQNQIHKELIKKEMSDDLNLFEEVLIESQKDILIVNICIDESEEQDSIIGYVNSVDDKEVVISRISENGLSDGESVILIDDIVKINCDSTDERILKLLHQRNINDTEYRT